MCKKRKWKRFQRKTCKKRRNSYSRDVNDPIYRQFRQDVIARDNNKCQWPGCKCSNYLEVHHILKWSDYPTLRFVKSNGITLCRFHHKLVKNREDYFIEFFRKLIEISLLKRLKELQ